MGEIGCRRLGRGIGLVGRGGVGHSLGHVFSAGAGAGQVGLVELEDGVVARVAFTIAVAITVRGNAGVREDREFVVGCLVDDGLSEFGAGRNRVDGGAGVVGRGLGCLLYTSPSPRDS